MDIPKVAVNVFVVREEKLLLGKRKGVGDGHWGLPGGHFEWMESLVEAAKRELEEETGLKVDKLDFLHIVNDPLPHGDGTHYVHINFTADGINGEPQIMEPNKCYEWKWFALDNLPPADEIFIGHKKCIPAFINKTTFSD